MVSGVSVSGVSGWMYTTLEPAKLAFVILESDPLLFHKMINILNFRHFSAL